ncbi:MAG: ABC-F family ATP-binding cassette domain-containing protein [Gammaproteobacteria bacterium]|nr:ABC-F family ATP-binding cassette domain-containing protein [Gammaproteobacteria bacterium]
MSTIICRHLTFGYPGAEGTIFEDLDLVIDTQWRSALTGRNGRGKTTLLRLIQGELEPDRGAIERGQRTAYFPRAVVDPDQEVRNVVKDAVGPFRQWEAEMDDLLADGSEDALTEYGEVLEAYQEAGGYAVEAGIEAELGALGIGETYWGRPFSGLSGGEQTRCLLASLFVPGSSSGPDTGTFALIDEPTNHLDRDGRNLLADYLGSKAGFLLVSHDRAFLDACCDHVVALNRDTVEVERTSFSAWRERFHQRLARQRADNAALKQEIARLGQVATDRRAGALKRESEKGAHVDKGFISARAKRQMRKAVSAERRAESAAEERRLTLVDVEKDRRLALPDSGRKAGSLVVANDLSLWRGDKAVFAKVSFTVAPGDRVAVIGPNGCGKTSLLDQIEGQNHRHTGTLLRPRHVAVARTFQHPQWTDGLLREHLQDAGIEESRFRQVMAVLGVRGGVLDGRIEDLSHGQQKKIDLARSFLANADLLLWDEPLNFIDIDAREQIEDVLLADQPTVVFVEHDAAFVERVATEVIDLSR